MLQGRGPGRFQQALLVISENRFRSIRPRDQPGWVTFSIDGRRAYRSTGDVIDTTTKKVIAGLKDENGTEVQIEKMLEIDFRGSRPIRAGDQFGIGQKK